MPREVFQKSFMQSAHKGNGMYIKSVLQTLLCELPEKYMKCD